MYCYNCGMQFQDSINFCPNCGAQINPANGNAVTTVGQKGRPSVLDRGATRESEINEVKKMLNYFSVKTEQYNEYDNVCRELYRLKKGRRMSCAVWGWILTIAGIVSIGFSAFNWIISGFGNYIPRQQTTITYGDGYSIYEDFGSLKTPASSPWFFLAVIAFFVLFAVLPGVLMIIVDKKKIKKGYNDELAYYSNRYCDLCDELYDHYLKYGNCSIGPEFTNPSNLQVILNTILSGRADTTKEAINVLVEDAHRKRMENYAAQTAEFAQKAAVNAGRAARASTVGAVFSAANFFS